MGRPEISVIVTTYQQAWHLQRVLMSLALQTVAHRLEVVISDDGSCDSTEQVVEQFARHAPFPVKWVTEPHRGFRLAACRNRGAAQSVAPHLLILDGDCLVPPDHVEQHLAAHRPGIVTNTYCVRLEQSVSERVTGVEVVSGDYVGWSPRVELQKLRRLQWKSQFYNWLGHPTRPTLRGGNVGITRDDFERVNGFDESFCGWGGEDDDFGLRLRAAGLRIEYILHRTRTYHLWHPPAPTRPPRIGAGVNIPYLHRRVRLVRCVNGVSVRPREDLICCVAGYPRDLHLMYTFLTERGLRLSSVAVRKPDVELLFVPGDGRFRGAAEYRALIAPTEATIAPRALAAADIVVSPGAQLGRPEQVRIPWESPEAWWTALGWTFDSLPAQAAA